MTETVPAETVVPSHRPAPAFGEAMRADEAALLAAGQRLTVGSDRPFLLRGDHVWFVASGYLDTFGVRLEEGVPVGPRSHVARVTAGRTVFGAGTPGDGEGWGLLAVGGHGTQLVKLPRNDLGGDPRSGRAATLVAEWVDALYAAMTRDKLPAISVELPLGQETEVAESKSLRVASELAWVRHVEGYSRLMARPGLEMNGAFTPVSRRAWLEPGAASRLLAVDTQGLPSALDLWCGLDRLHELVCRFVEMRARAEEEASLRRMRRKGVSQQALLSNACERLAGVMQGAPSARFTPALTVGPADVDEAQDPLFAACELVAAALHLTLNRNARSESGPAPRNRLAAILRGSRLRSRRVALREQWWREDSGPLLARRSSDKCPVALLRRGSSGPYLLSDPIARTEQPVDADLAASLEPFGHSFYRPFPEIALKIGDIVRFGLLGSRRDAIVIVAMIVCSALVGMVPAIATGMLFSTVIPGAQRPQLLQLTAVLLACAVVNALFGLARSLALLRVESRASAALQAAVWDRLLAVPLPFFRGYTAGALASRAMAIDAIRQVISGSTVGAIVGGITALGNFGLMYWYSPSMARWGTVIIAVVVAVTLAGTWIQKRPQRALVQTSTKLAGLVLQLLTSISKLRVAAAEVPAFARWVSLFSEQRRLQYQARSVANWLAAFQAAVPVLSTAIIFSLALPLITEKKELLTGDFMAFLSAFTTCSGAILASSAALLATVNTLPLYEQAKPILETMPEVDAGKSDPGVLTGDIEIQHAMFRYQPDGPLVIRDVSIHIRSGEFVAFVGPSGSGKSTLLRILLGFERMAAGTIYYDGQEIGGLDVHALRRQMGVVLQSGRLMSGDIQTNITGASNATLDDAWEAARMAGLEEDIKAMPMGMHTVISEGAGTLSGGQRQRLLIARAIVNRPRILLFDEATSALDNRTQAVVSASLESLQATRIVVAHRLSTIMNADRILVMDRGQLAESGTYAELMARNGRFAELAKRQIA